VDGRPLETDYAGNYADICPTGSLTLKDFRFRKRVWFLKKTPTVCEGCARGCNMDMHQDAGVIYRCTPRENMAVNKYWMCDEGRFNFHYVGDKNRILQPRTAPDGKDTDWDQALEAAKTALKGKKVALLVGSDLTQEEAKILMEFAPKAYPGAPIFHYGTPGVINAKDDAPADRILKRKSKTSNLHGLEKLGLKGYEGLPAGTDAVVVFRGGRATIPADLKNTTKVGVGVFAKGQTDGFAAVLPGLSFAEKDGTIVNFEGREQRIKRTITPRGQSKALSEILMVWARGKAPQKEGVA
jgi:NADH-quinone oxidoreductase subunit G